MSSERLSQLHEQLFLLEGKIRPLEWDMERKQINEFRKVELSRLKLEQTHLQAELKQLETQTFINNEPASDQS